MKARTIAAAIAATALLAAPAAVAGNDKADPDHTTVIGGDDRYETAALIAHHAEPDGMADTIYIANGETMVDALAVGVTDSDGVVLLVEVDEVPKPTINALQDISHGELVFLGGDSAISEKVRDKVSGLTCNHNTSSC